MSFAFFAAEATPTGFVGLQFPVADILGPVDTVGGDCLGVIDRDDIHGTAKGIQNPFAVTDDVDRLFIANNSFI